MAIRTRLTFSRGLVLSALVLAFSVPASAQSLSELYEAARSYDATYLAARAQADSATYRAAQADALRRPSVNLNASSTYVDSDSPVTRVGTVVAQGGATTSLASVQGRQPLFNRANDATIDQAYRALEVANADLATVEQDLIVRVAQAYFDVLGAQDTLAFSRASKAAISEQLAAAKRNFEVGTATITDTREAQARFDLSTAVEIAADNDLRTKQIALNQLIGRANVAPKPLAAPVKLPPLTPGDVDSWVADIDQQHPQVRKARLALEIAQLETAKAQAGHLPTVDLVAALNATKASGSGASVPGTTTNGSLGVQLALPLYAGNAVQNRIKETLALEEKSRNDLDAARRGVAQSTRQAYFGVQSGRAQVSALEAAEASSQLALESTQLGYRVGVRVNLDVLNAQTQLFLTRRDLAKSRYDVIVGDLRLRQAAGSLKPEDVATANVLLAK